MRRLLISMGCGLSCVLCTPVAATAAGGPVPPQQGGAGVSTPGAAFNFVAIAAGRNTIVTKVRRGTGAIESTGSLRGAYGIPGVAYDGSNTGLSADGRTLVLANAITRYPVRNTRLVVLRAASLRTIGEVRLRGYYSVDAISPDGRTLYLIHYRTQDGNNYEVRAFDLATHRMLSKPIVDPRDAAEKMQGFPITRSVSADGRWAYTLYGRGDKPPFIHALDTRDRAARCIDLDALATVDQGILHMRLGRGGTTLTVDGGGAPLAVVDAHTFSVSTPPRTAVGHGPVTAASSDGGGLPWWPIGAVLAVLLAGAAIILRRRPRPESQRG